MPRHLELDPDRLLPGDPATRGIAHARELANGLMRRACRIDDSYFAAAAA